MHELGIVFEVIDSVEKMAKENNVKKVVEITMEIGEVSTVIPSYFEECFSWAIQKHEILKDCKLEIVVLEGRTFCNDCKKTYSTVKYGKKCPYCNSENTYLLTGEELSIRDIKVVD